jgi:RimJ/RimL family protein N-acetyltransferase
MLTGRVQKGSTAGRNAPARGSRRAGACYDAGMDLRLDTPRLELRPMTLGDVGSLHALMIDPDVRRWAMDGRVVPEASSRMAVLKSIASFRRHGTGAYALRLREGGAFVGYAGLFPAKLARVGGYELGAAIWPRYWRQGLAAEACRAILAEAFGPLGLERVLACTDAPNFRSLALLATLGFRQIATTPGAFGTIRWFGLDRP